MTAKRMKQIKMVFVVFVSWLSWLFRPLKWQEGLLYAVVSAVVGVLLPWWGGFVIVALAGGFIFGKEARRAPRRGLAVLSGIMWVTAAFIKDMETSFQLSTKVTALFSLKHAVVLYGVLFLIAALLAWLAAHVGVLARAVARSYRWVA